MATEADAMMTHVTELCNCEDTERLFVEIS